MPHGPDVAEQTELIATAVIPLLHD
jgi:hypothetical protein